MISPRRRREDSAVPSRRRLPAETPRVLPEALTEKSRSPVDPTLAECLCEVFAKASRSPHGAFMNHSCNGLAVAPSRRVQHLIILFHLIAVSLSSFLCIYFAVCRIRCPCPFLPAWVVFMSLMGLSFLRSLLRSVCVVAFRLVILFVLLFVFVFLVGIHLYI